VLQPRYAEAFPLTPADLDALTTTLVGEKLPARDPAVDIYRNSSPRYCGVVAQLGAGLTSSSDPKSGGVDAYHVWGFGSADSPWINARLFATLADAAAFLDEVEAAAPSCGEYYRPEDTIEWGVTSFSRDGDVLRLSIAPYGTAYVIKRYENAVFLLLFEEDAREDPYYLDQIP
jgi:hypothetical protein